ncbi:MAG: hypothetical protein ABJC26_12335, partial [Gemmatimonadaceae bacterium]
MTSYSEFQKAALTCVAKGGLVPVWRDCLLDLVTPVAAYAKLRQGAGPFSFLLESAPAGGEAWSRYTYMGAAPRGAWRLRDGVIHDWNAKDGWHNPRTPVDPLSDLQTIVRDLRPVEAPELGQFWSGAVGFFSYDVVRHIENLPHAPKRALNYPDACFVFTDALVVIDNWRGQARVIVSVPIEPGADEAWLKSAYEAAQNTLNDTTRRLQNDVALPPLNIDQTAKPAVARSMFPREEYLKA